MTLVDDIKDSVNQSTLDVSFTPNKGDLTKVVSTGSTLLDLAISGGRVQGGGLPAGILLEVSGPAGIGKTAILSESVASCQARGGEAIFCDPEARLDKEYSLIYGMEIDKDHYERPDTVNQLFKLISDWKPKNPDVVNIIAGDSLAALSTEMEMESEDKMGMKRAKDFSTGLRKSCRLIAQNNWILACSNQERDGTFGKITPGGNAIGYYASLRIRMTKASQGFKILKTKTIKGKKVEKIVGIHTNCEIIKSSVDEPYRKCSLFIMFGMGIDDIRGNLYYLKEFNGKYVAVDKEYATIEPAIAYIEDNNYELQLRQMVVETWQEVQDAFVTQRKPKKRF